jgi:hypothetical protein
MGLTRFLASIIASVAVAAPAMSSEGIRAVGFFKDARENRIFTFAVREEVSLEAVRAHSQTLAYTRGQMSGAYYYPEGPGIPAGGFRSAKTVPEVNELLYDSAETPPWHYAWQRGFNGKSVFVNCRITPREPLCKARGE